MPRFEGEWRVAPAQVAYPEAIATMEARVAGLREGEAGELVWLVEHPPTYTSGTSARRGDLLASEGVEIFSAGRGGQWTYHGPGQRVVYLMLDLNRAHGSVRARDLHDYVDGLERWIIAALALLGVRGEQRQGRVGIWVVDSRTGAEAKIAAIGVRITRWVSWHGIAINVAPDLAHYGGIVPCGIREFGVTSLEALGNKAGMAQLDAALAASFGGIFGGE